MTFVVQASRQRLLRQRWSRRGFHLWRQARGQLPCEPQLAALLQVVEALARLLQLGRQARAATAVATSSIHPAEIVCAHHPTWREEVLQARGEIAVISAQSQPHPPLAGERDIARTRAPVLRPRKAFQNLMRVILARRATSRWELEKGQTFAVMAMHDQSVQVGLIAARISTFRAHPCQSGYPRLQQEIIRTTGPGRRWSWMQLSARQRATLASVPVAERGEFLLGILAFGNCTQLPWAPQLGLTPPSMVFPTRRRPTICPRMSARCFRLLRRTRPTMQTSHRLAPQMRWTELPSTLRLLRTWMMMTVWLSRQGATGGILPPRPSLSNSMA